MLVVTQERGKGSICLRVCCESLDALISVIEHQALSSDWLIAMSSLVEGLLRGVRTF